MSAPSFYDQIEAANKFSSPELAVQAMNALVTNPCPELPRTWRTLWFKPSQHRWVDLTNTLNTITYTTFDRCERCGMCVLGSGL